MANTDCPFFYTARSIGVNKVVVSLATYPALEWRGRQAVLVAEAEQEALRLYAMDMLWMLVKREYQGDFPQPSKLIKHETKPKGPQTAEEIINHIIDGLSNCNSARVVSGNQMIRGEY